MEYIYAAMLIHKAGQKISDANVTQVLEAAGVKPDPARVKAVVAALDGVNIDEAIQKAAMLQAPAPVASAPSSGGEEKKETKKKEEDKKSEEQAAAGLGALFG